MSSFFEKLKRGMGIEEPEPVKEKEEKVKEKKERIKKIRKLEIEITPIEEKIKKPSPTKATEEKEERQKTREEVIEEKEVEIKKPALAPTVAQAPLSKKISEGKERWLGQEGQLAVDVYQTESELVIQSAIAGVKPGDLDISIEGDIITIEGERKKPFEESGDYFSEECYWGQFSRQLLLPVEVDPNRIEATLKEGILTIRMPRIQREKKRKVIVKE